jgi:hypothetical protein
MIIPHVAIVSGLLLAGNSANTLEASSTPSLIRKPSPEPQVPKSGLLFSVMNAYFPVSNSVYQPVWMWERGRNKRNWIRAVQRQYHLQAWHAPTTGRLHRRIIVGLRILWRNSLDSSRASQVPMIGIFGWVVIILTASILVAIPFVLAYMTSYYTPTIGISCRTLTLLLSFLFQACLTVLWLIDFSNAEHLPFYSKDSISPTLFFVLTLLCISGSALTTTVGTFLQLLGVYRNCLCNIPMSA